MLGQQIESASNKLIQFIQDLTCNIQTIYPKENFFELFQLRSDYAKQLASLFDILITKLLEEYFPNRIIQIQINLDPVQIWRLIQSFIDQLNDIQSQDLNLIIKHIRNINKYFYNLLLQLKNSEFFKVDQTRTINENLIEELNHLSESLIHFTTIFSINSQKINNPKPLDTYLFQSLSTTPYSNNNNNNHVNETIPNLSSTDKSNINSSCYPCDMTNNLQQQQQQFQWNSIRRGPCFPPNSRTVPTTTLFPQSKPMGCSTNSGKDDTPTPLCFSAPVVYTPEMETLFSSDGIIYARKSGNTWIAENLGTLIETLKDIGQTIDMNEHCEILVRKTGELFVRQKRGRRKRFLKQTLTKETSHRNNAYEQSDSDSSNDDQ